MPIKQKIHGFGGFPVGTTSLFELSEPQPKNALIYRGKGNSYGDIAQGENTISTLEKSQVLALNLTEKWILVEAGITLKKVLIYLENHGFTLPVVPGILDITVGGAVASDVHGKNHVKKGTFGHHVLEFSLQQNTKNSPFLCSRQQFYELFKATLGGCGLTGQILSVKLAIEPLTSTAIVQETRKIAGLQNLISALKASTAHYKIVWLQNQQQGHLITGDFSAEKDAKPINKVKKVPFHFGGWLTSRPVLKLYNSIKFHSAKPSQTLHYRQFLCPLDQLKDWNKLYGKSGIIQFQFVIDEKHLISSIELVFNKIKAKNLNWFIPTIKQFGSIESCGLLSFPREGFTFTIDVKYRPGLEIEMRQWADEIIAKGGRFYLAKDSFLTREQLTRSYRNFSKFEETTKNLSNYQSDFSKRIHLHT